jgi:hypothetical protein
MDGAPRVGVPMALAREFRVDGRRDEAHRKDLHHAIIQLKGARPMHSLHKATCHSLTRHALPQCPIGWRRLWCGPDVIRAEGQSGETASFERDHGQDVSSHLLRKSTLGSGNADPWHVADSPPGQTLSPWSRMTTRLPFSYLVPTYLCTWIISSGGYRLSMTVCSPPACVSCRRNP